MSKKLQSLVCTCCGKDKKINNYYKSHSKLYKAIGYLPICKDCIDYFYKQYKDKYKNEKDVIFNFCRLFDFPYNDNILAGAIQHSNKTGWKVYQSYIKHINSFINQNDFGTCFDEGEMAVRQYLIEENDLNQDIEVDLDTQLFWGFGFEPKDYVFLESELVRWKQTHKCDNQAEITLLKEICIKILEIRKLREQGKSVGKQQKELQDLMKTASVDPAKANAASTNESMNTFGLWIKDIEENEPAEFFEDKALFHDFDQLKKYADQYIFRPLKNLLTGSRDFNIDGGVLNTDDEDDN